MKKKFLIFLIPVIFLFEFSGCNNQNTTPVTSENIPMNFQEVSEYFKNPPIDYSTAPFWVWNDRVTRDKIDLQLKEYKERGMHMVFIHPRPGLITEYLGREWFELTEYALDKARELDMKIWLYDENSFPSGFAGGHVPAMMPESYDQGSGLTLHKLENLTMEDGDRYFLVIKKIGNSFANITNGIKNYIDQPGEYYAFKKWYYPRDEAWFGGWSYVDLLVEGVTEKFIKLTMRDYEKTIGNDLGGRVPGIFTDEPNINMRGSTNSTIRWTPDLFEKFEERFGYQLQIYLPCLYEDIGDYKNVRHDYYALLLDLFIERWSVPWFEYTDSMNIAWTGHYWEHGWPNPKHGGDNMAMYAWHQIPGIDMLFNTESLRPDQFGNVRAVKELSSVANQLGRRRALSETYGGAGWELTFADMKRLGDWEYVLGVNFMNQHLSYMTIKGGRKRDFPQSMSYHTPWWDSYKPLNDYFHRLSYVLAAGIQENRILILEPTTTTWMHFSPVQDRGHLGVEGFLDKYRNSFHDMLNKLEKHQVEYDLGSERIIRDHGKAENASFRVGKRSYDLLILPPNVENLEASTFQLIRDYISSGGKIISLSDPPEYLDGNFSKKIRTEISTYKESWVQIDSISKNIVDAHLKSPDFNPINPEKWGGRVFHMRRKLKDGQLLFWINFDKQEKADINFSISGKSARILDAYNGSINSYPVEPVGKHISISHELLPYNSFLLFISDQPSENMQSDENIKENVQTINIDDLEISNLKPNMLTLDYCDLKIGNTEYKDMYFYNAADSIFKHHLKEPYGFNYNPWSVAVQYRTNILDKNRFDSLSGFEAVFPFHIKKNAIPEELKAVVEWTELYRFEINGNTVIPLEGEWWLDRSFGVLDLSGHLREGRNELKVTARPMDIHAELEPVYLLGEFGLETFDKGWLITEKQDLDLGSWKNQGYPFYSDKVAYQTTFHNDDPEKIYVLKTENWKGTVVDVYVNDEKAGIIAWPPYELDISEFLSEGENNISVRVCGSLKNLLGPHHNNPRKGVVTPWSFFYAPASQPPGKSYDLLDYGLYEHFKLLVYE